MSLQIIDSLVWFKNFVSMLTLMIDCVVEVAEWSIAVTLLNLDNFKVIQLEIMKDSFKTKLLFSFVG